MNELKVIQNCQHGRMEEFGQIYDQYIDKIYKFIYYKTMHRETAEDLTSQTFAKAMEAISSFNQQKGSFSSWLYRIARNNVIDYYRTAKNVEDIDGIYNLSDNSNLPIDLDIKQKLSEVIKYLEKIKLEQREIVVMRLWGQLSYQEISDITNKTAANCKMIFSRTMIKLREEIALGLTLFILFIIKFINI